MRCWVSEEQEERWAVILSLGDKRFCKKDQIAVFSSAEYVGMRGI